NAAVGKLMGGSAAQFPERYAAGNPSAHLPLRTRIRVVQGEKDPIVPVSQARNFMAHYENIKYRDAKLVLLPNAGHFDLVAPTSPTWPTIEQAVRDVLQKY